MPIDVESMRAICLDDSGNAKEKNDCRATIINHFILDDMMDIDEAEEKTENILNELGLWQKESNEESSEENAKLNEE